MVSRPGQVKEASPGASPTSYATIRGNPQGPVGRPTPRSRRRRFRRHLWPCRRPHPRRPAPPRPRRWRHPLRSHPRRGRISSERSSCPSRRMLAAATGAQRAVRRLPWPSAGNGGVTRNIPRIDTMMGLTVPGARGDLSQVQASRTASMPHMIAGSGTKRVRATPTRPSISSRIPATVWRDRDGGGPPGADGRGGDRTRPVDCDLDESGQTSQRLPKRAGVAGWDECGPVGAASRPELRPSCQTESGSRRSHCGSAARWSGGDAGQHE